MNRRLILTISAFVMTVCVMGQAAAQRRSVNTVPALEQLPRVAIDTLETADPETKLILYSNNTFGYYRPDFEARVADLPVFNEYWDTTQVFAYKALELKDLPDEIDLCLIGAMCEFRPPITGPVRSKYGVRGRRNHNGIDIALKTGEPIYATFDGKVRYSTYNSGGFGNLVIVRHPNGLETWYAHLTRRNVEVNDYVKAGQVIGYGGSTGRSTGPHLHYEIRYCDQTFDPERLIAFEDGDLHYQTFVLEKSFFSILSRSTDQLEEFDDFQNIAELAAEEDVTPEDILAYLSAEEQAKREAEYRKSLEVYHVVRNGDMLGSIAPKYGVSIDQICRLNNISRTTTLRLGRKLRVQ